MRPLDELQRDAWKQVTEGNSFIVINRAELKTLKDFGMVTGTSNPNLAQSVYTFGVAIDFIIKDDTR